MEENTVSVPLGTNNQELIGPIMDESSHDSPPPEYSEKTILDNTHTKSSVETYGDSNTNNSLNLCCFHVIRNPTLAWRFSYRGEKNNSEKTS